VTVSDAEARKQAETARNLWDRFTGWLGDRFRKKPEPPLFTVEARQKALAVREAQFREAAERLAGQVYSGDITVAQWQAAMKGEVKSLLVDATVIGAGGDRTLVSAREWGATGQRCRTEYRLLARYADEIVKRAEEDRLTLAYLKYRSNLYSGAARHPFARAELAQRPEEYFSWRLNVRKYTAESEHCPDCKARVGHPDFTHVRKEDIKNWPGDLTTQCGCNCNCGWVAD
jgi:hypothetical protein